MTARPPRVARQAPIVAAAVAGGLWLLDVLTSQDLVLGQGAAHALIEALAVAASAVFAIVLTAHVILALASARAATTGFQRMLVYTLVTFPVCFLTLQHFGFDLRSVLAGSAIASVAVGLAMQPTLGSMIAGLALQLDHVLRVDDAILHEGEPVRVTRLDWRTVVGRRSDGRVVVFPNGRLSDNPLEVLPGDLPMRADIAFHADLDEPPQRICELARELVADLALVDVTRPILVAPSGFDTDRTQYRIRYWTRFYWRAGLIEGEVLRRIWYLFQRHGVAFHRGAPVAGPAAGDIEADIAAALAGRRDPGPEAAAALAKDGRLLLFAPDERLVMPEWAEGWRLLLLRGDCVDAPEFDFVRHDFAALPPMAVERLGRGARVREIAEALTDRIGPYAEHAVAKAAAQIADIDRLCRAVALEIEDEAERAAFLAAVRPQPEAPAAAEPFLRVRRNAAGSLVTHGNLRARSEVAIWAFPSA